MTFTFDLQTWFKITAHPSLKNKLMCSMIQIGLSGEDICSDKMKCCVIENNLDPLPTNVHHSTICTL